MSYPLPPFPTTTHRLQLTAEHRPMWEVVELQYSHGQVCNIITQEKRLFAGDYPSVTKFINEALAKEVVAGTVACACYYS